MDPTRSTGTLAPPGRGQVTLRIAHLSDTHVLSPLGVEVTRLLFDKRITGYANLLLRRGRVYRREYLLAVLEAAAAARPDHLVVTGDLANLSLEHEFEEADRLLRGMAPIELSVIPGNHDVYTPATFHARRFGHHFGRYQTSDLPELAVELPAGHFPFVKLRGPAAIIGLSSAVPRPPFVASGRLGSAQLVALGRVLAHPEVARRLPVVLVHHPPLNPPSRVEVLRDGLTDADALRGLLAPLARGLVLHGHLHERRLRTLPTSRGHVDVVGAAGAAVDHPDPSRRAGFNLYEIADDGRIETCEARVLPAGGEAWGSVPVPLRDEEPPMPARRGRGAR